MRSSHVLCDLPGYIVTFGSVLASFCQLYTNWDIFRKRESQEIGKLPPSDLKFDLKLPLYPGLWPCLWGIFFTNDWCVRSQRRGWSHSQGCSGKQAEHAMEQDSKQFLNWAPTWLLLMINFIWTWKSNKSSPFHVCFWSWWLLQHKRN